MSVFLNPKFLHHAMKAQEAFGKAMQIDDKHSTRARFEVFDMLDMLDEDLKAIKKGETQ